MLPLILKELLLPVGIQAFKMYVESSSSKKDDKVLEMVQYGADYLSRKPNNTLRQNEAQNLKFVQMKKLQG
jgi:hypothetical protein